MSVFLDTSVLLAGLIDFGPQSAPAQSIMHAAAERRLASPATAWHCCLEFFSVATRGCRPSSGFPPVTRACSCRKKSSRARAVGATVVVTDNRRHFLSALRYGIRVETPAEFVSALKDKR